MRVRVRVYVSSLELIRGVFPYRIAMKGLGRGARGLLKLANLRRNVVMRGVEVGVVGEDDSTRRDNIGTGRFREDELVLGEGFNCWTRQRIWYKSQAPRGS